MFLDIIVTVSDRKHIRNVRKNTQEVIGDTRITFSDQIEKSFFLKISDFVDDFFIFPSSGGPISDVSILTEKIEKLVLKNPEMVKNSAVMDIGSVITVI